MTPKTMVGYLYISSNFQLFLSLKQNHQDTRGFVQNWESSRICYMEVMIYFPIVNLFCMIKLCLMRLQSANCKTMHFDHVIAITQRNIGKKEMVNRNV